MNKGIFRFADAPKGEDDADGIWYYTPVLEDIKSLPHPPCPPGKDFLAATYTSRWTGALTGDSADTGMLVAHGKFPQAAPMVFVGTCSFKGTFRGVSGSLEMDTIGHRPDPTAEWWGAWSVTGGTGDLEGLRARGTFWGPGWLGDPAEPGVIYYAVDEVSGIDFGDDD